MNPDGKLARLVRHRRGRRTAGHRGAGHGRIGAAIIIATLAPLALAGSVPGVAQEPPDGAVCALFSPDEVQAAMGTALQPADTSDEYVAGCSWVPTDPASAAQLDVTWSIGTADEIRADPGGLTEVVVGGQTAWQDIGVLLIALDAGLLSLQGIAEDDGDEDALATLGEIAVPRTDALPSPPEDAWAALPSSTPAGDTSGEAFCALLTPGEVEEILGGPAEAEAGVGACSWSTGSSDARVTMNISWTPVTLDQQQATWPDGERITVGGRPAYLSPGFFLDELLVELDAGVLWLGVTGFEGDVAVALPALGGLAVPRAGALPPMP